MAETRYVSSGTSLHLITFPVAAFCSYMINKSIMWAILHGFFGTLYLLYLCFGCGGGFTTVEQNFNKIINPAPTEQTSEIPSENQ